VKKGDRVIIYMPMIPEAAIAMLACARIGATHSVVFGGLLGGLDSRPDRDSKGIARHHRGRRLPARLDRAAEEERRRRACATARRGIRKVIVYRRAATTSTSRKAATSGGTARWSMSMRTARLSRSIASTRFSSSTPAAPPGKPKGILHTTGGYLLQAYTTCKYVFDLRDEDVYWCTADVGWVTGHSYVVYGPLAMGATSLMFEGAPNWPENDRFWKIIAEYGVTVFYTAPTAIRAFIRWGDAWVEKHDLSSLRLLGTVGEPINPEAWMWYHQIVGGGRCPIVDTWWQTETGGHMITPFPGATPTKPGSATLPFFGVNAAVVDDQGKEVPPNVGGKLVIRSPWPGMLRSIYGDKARYKKTYWSEVPGCYFAGDGARRDKDGYFWIVGRIDDVLNVAGHRLGTSEVESALVSHGSVAEAAVVGRPDELKGQAVVCFVTLKGGQKGTDELRGELRAHVRQVIGPVATPDEIRFTEALPKDALGQDHAPPFEGSRERQSRYRRHDDPRGSFDPGQAERVV
jgi:acetyl-CoA synthetase